jgi:hypothetical protein
MCIEVAIKEIKDKKQLEVRLSGKKVLPLANDKVFCTEKEELQILLHKMEDILGNCGMKLKIN